MHTGRGRGKEGGGGRKEGKEREREWAVGRKREGRREGGR